MPNPTRDAGPLRGNVLTWLGRNPRIGRRPQSPLSLGIGVPFLSDNRQLQNPSVLSLRQEIYEHYLSVRKREGVVMLFRRARLNRAKPGNSKACALGQQPMPVVSDVMFERELGSRKQTYGDTRLVLRGKAARGCAVKTGGNECLSNLGWTRCKSMQAIIAHWLSPVICVPEKRYPETASDTLTDVKISSARDRSEMQ